MKPLIDHVGPDRKPHPPEATVKTGADVLGGGATKTLEPEASDNEKK